MMMTVKDFFEFGKDALDLRMHAGQEGWNRSIREPVLNRPGLVFSGFFKYFAEHRIQVCGLAEMAYLKNMAPEIRTEHMRPVFERRPPCLVVTRNLRIFDEMVPLAREFHVPILRTRMKTGDFILKATLLIEEQLAPRTRMQGTMVDIGGVGVLIEGTPGVGKSEAALGLLRRGHSLVADDVTELRKSSAGGLIGTAPDITRYHMEIRGLGIIHVPSLFGVTSVRRSKRLDLIVTLLPGGPLPDVERTGLAAASRNVLEVDIPCVAIPVAPGRDITHVVEAAALNQRLKQLGHDAAKELDTKLMSALQSGHMATSD